MVHRRRFHALEVAGDESDVLTIDVVCQNLHLSSLTGTAASSWSIGTSTSTVCSKVASGLVARTALFKSTTATLVDSTTSTTGVAVSTICSRLWSTGLHINGFFADLVRIGLNCCLVSGGIGVFDKSTVLKAN